MLFSIEQVYFYIYNRISCKNTFLHSFRNSLLNSRDISLGNCTTLDGVDKSEILASLYRLDLEMNLCKLAMTAGLLLMSEAAGCLLGHCLPVSNLRNLGGDTDLLVVLDLVQDHVDLKLTHSGNDSLSCLLVVGDTECVVLGGSFLHELSQLILVLLVIGRYRNLVCRGRQTQLDECVLELACEHCVVSQGKRHLGCDTDITCNKLVKVNQLLSDCCIKLCNLLFLPFS